MAKTNTKEVIEYLRNAGAAEEDIPILAMTAFYESTFDTLAKNKDTEAIGLFQINASSFYDGIKPDNTLRSFFGNEMLSVTDFEKKLEDPQYNTNFAIHYLNVIKKDLEDGSSQFPDVKRNNNDPFAVFEGYLDYVKPFIAGGKLAGRGQDEMKDITTGIGIYVDAFMDINKIVPSQPPTPPMPTETQPSLGMEMRAEGYADREMANLNRKYDGVDQSIIEFVAELGRQKAKLGDK